MTRRILEPNDTWISDWRLGVEEDPEREVSRQLLNIFQGFWQGEELGAMKSGSANSTAVESA